MWEIFCEKRVVEKSPRERADIKKVAGFFPKSASGEKFDEDPI